MRAPSAAPSLRVVIDANVLCYLALARLLLGLAHREGLFLPYWSQQILEEAWRTYAVKFERGAQYAHARLSEFTVGFPDALQADLGLLIAQCTNHEKDRHVLATTIKAQAKIIVTFNQKDFLPQDLAKWDIRAVSPDDFLLELYEKSPDAVGRQLKLAAADKRMEIGDLVRGYSRQLKRFKAALLADLP